jgi:hypothetical protein
MGTAAWVHTSGVDAAPRGRGGAISVTATATVEASTTSTKPSQRCPDVYTRRRPVDLVICLDTSGSMTALIDSARAKLWDIVNEVAQEKPTPRLRVGLFTYGSPNLSTQAQGWVVRQLDLTDDLDTVYAKMMEMSTNGGDEYVGWVLNDALHTMSWSRDPDAVKLIFVAGNESADQAAGYFNFRSAAETARGRGIIINAIYAGSRQTGIAEHWDEVAMHGGGVFSAIDMQSGTVQITTPQDKILIRLNAELNATYVPFGKSGRVGAAKQIEQDRNAEKFGGQSAASRVTAKSSGIYSNSHWDIVDAAEREGFDVGAVATEELPATMKTMSKTERKSYVKQKRRTRRAVQQRIQEVSEQRNEHLKDVRKKRKDGKTSLDDAVRSMIREQMSTKKAD